MLWFTGTSTSRAYYITGETLRQKENVAIVAWLSSDISSDPCFASRVARLSIRGRVWRDEEVARDVGQM
jgi:hypothetical protein